MVKEWQKKEKRDARAFGASLTKASGRIWDRPGDSMDENFLYESKHTTTKSFTISKQKWDKLRGEAAFRQCTPVLSVQMQDLELVVMSKEDFALLLRKGSVS